MKTTKVKTLKKIGGIVVDILVLIVFLISVVLVVANVSVDKEKGQTPNVFGYVISSVQTDSMSGTFEEGALVVGKLVDEDTVIKKDDIISFYQKEGKDTFINTHRVVAVETIDGNEVYQTQGDNRERCPRPDDELKTINDVQSVYKFHIAGLGGFIDFLKKPVGFVVCLVLPMLAFIAWQIYKLIVIYLNAKKEQMIEEAKEGVSDETKDAIIREYLEKMQNSEKAPEIQKEETVQDQKEETVQDQKEETVQDQKEESTQEKAEEEPTSSNEE